VSRSRILIGVFSAALVAGSLAFGDGGRPSPRAGLGLSKQQLDKLYQIQVKYQKENYDLQMKTLQKVQVLELTMIRGLQDKIMKLQSKKMAEIEKLLEKDQKANVKRLMQQEGQNLKKLQTPMKQLEKQLEKVYKEQVIMLQEQAKVMEKELEKVREEPGMELQEQEPKKLKK